jgi:transglutaminase-like putative cysteine protease
MTWYYDSGDGKGCVHPASTAQIKRLYKKGIIGTNTKVYSVRYDGALLLWQIPEFRQFILNYNANIRASRYTPQLKHKKPLHTGCALATVFALAMLCVFIAAKTTSGDVGQSEKVVSDHTPTVSDTTNNTAEHSSEDDDSSNVSEKPVVKAYTYTFSDTSRAQKSYDIRSFLSSPVTTDYVVTNKNERVDLTISGNTLSAPSGCEIHDASEIRSGGRIPVGFGSNQRELSGSDIQTFLIYVPGQPSFLFAPPILQLSDGTYSFADFTKQNTKFYVTSKNKIVSDPTYFKSVAGEICSGADTDLKKVQAVYDWIATNCAYDNDVLRDRSLYEADDVASFRSRRGVCENFARWTCDLLNAEGVDCVLVSGIGLNGQDSSYEQKTNHAWNIVKIDGNWYPMDVTWDCGNKYDNGNVTPGDLRETYFLNVHAINQNHIMIEKE